MTRASRRHVQTFVAFPMCETIEPLFPGLEKPQ